MNLAHLKYLIAVEKYESISKAANKLYINQPHLSKIIKDMEEEVNIKIFERHNKGVVPTKKGRQFLIQVKRIVHEVNHLEDMFKESPNRIQLDLAVPRASYIAKAFTDFLNRQEAQEKEITVNYRETNSEDTIQRVYDGENNLGIIRIAYRDKDYYMNLLQLKELECEELFHFEYRMLMSKDNPLAHKRVFSKDLLQQIELVHGDMSIPESLDISGKKEIHIYERGIQFELLSQLKTSYMWVSPMPESTLQSMSLVTNKCLDKKMDYVDYVIYRKGYSLTLEDQMFIEHIKSVINTIKNQ